MSSLHSDTAVDAVVPTPRGDDAGTTVAAYRAMVAASLLAGRDYEVISVNDHFSNAASAGVPLEGG